MKDNSSGLNEFFTSEYRRMAVKLLWNWLMPSIFGLGTITFMQGFGLILLARLLVGGWHREHKDDAIRNKSPFF